MSDNHADFAPLIDLLSQQLDQYNQLLSLTVEARQSLIDGDIERLTEFSRNQYSRLSQLKRLEKKRLAAAAALSGELKLSPAATLAEMIPLATGAQKQELSRLHSDFAALMPQLVVANDANRLLLETNVAFNDMMLELVTGEEDPLNNFYNQDGSEPEEKIVSPSLFDQQI